MNEPALFLRHHYASPTLGTVIDNASLRRSDLVLRCTKYRNVIVDERVLTKSFELVTRPQRLLATIVLEGQLLVDVEGAPLRAGPGEGVLHATELLAATRYDRTTTLELDWVASTTSAPRMLAAFDRDRAEALADDLFRELPQRPLFERAFALFREAGAPIESSIDALEGSPTDRDRRIATAMSEQLKHLSSRATTLHLGDTAKLSPRQLQRIVQDFNARYGVNARNWRDVRNRWRVQIAVVLLSVEGLPVETIAKEVGYGTAGALARAMATVGFPPPQELRSRLGQLK